jgi:hypothetical protein
MKATYDIVAVGPLLLLRGCYCRFAFYLSTQIDNSLARVNWDGGEFHVSFVEGHEGG